jgi:transaldolase
MLDTPLSRTARLGPTDYWNDSCAVDELAYAIERGAVGATSNPSIVLDVIGKEKAHWVPRVRELAAVNPAWTEVDLTWAIIEEMAVRGAALLAPIHARESGRKGWLSVQTNPANYPDSARIVEQAVRFSGLAPNLHAKMPATSAGMVAIEESTARGVSVNVTVSFTVPQALAAAEAVERGLRRFEASGGDPAKVVPMVTIMIGRLDDWMKVVVERDGLPVNPAALDWAGIAAFKRAYGIFKERGYRGRLLAAAYRHHLHWTELVGGDVSMTIPYAWQVRFNASGIDPVARMHEPVDPAIIAELLEKIPDFRCAYEPGGLTPAEFDTYGPTVRTLRAFIKSYHDLQAAIRDIVLPNPDVRTA